MPLIAKPDPNGPANPTSTILHVYSGNLLVGIIRQQNSGGSLRDTWGFNITFTTRPTLDAGEFSAGGYPTMEEAMTEFRKRFEAWIEWAELKEVD